MKKIKDILINVKYWVQDNWVDLSLGLLLLIFSPLIIFIGIIYLTLEYPYWCIKEKRVIPQYEWIHYKYNQAILMRLGF